MRLTIKEPDINIGVDGFADHCQLGRAETGKKLSDLVEKIDDPIVIALDGSWGSGKSFFLKCWTGAHTKENGGTAKVIYFDAFKHDFLDDPLIALTGVMADHFEPKSKGRKALNKAKQAISKMWRPAARISLAVATAGTSEVVGAVGDAALAAGSVELSKASENFWKQEDGRRAAMEDFKAALTELTKPGEDGQPPQKIVIIIDELDRCRPDYALSMLEVMKHFFAVDNVHFVLGVNLIELQNSVRARYGVDIDAERYLRKFINLKLTLNMNTSFSYNSLPPNTNLKSHFAATAQKLEVHERPLVSYIDLYLEEFILPDLISLRDVEQIAALLVVTQSINDTDTIGFRLIISGLIVLKIIRPSLYQKALNGSLLFEELSGIFNKPKKGDRKWRTLLYVWSFYLHPEETPEIEIDLSQEEITRLNQSSQPSYYFDVQDPDLLPKIIHTYVETLSFI